MSKSRELGTKLDQQRTHQLRNEICRLACPITMAGAASHLRGYAVAESIALIGRLDSHPQIVGRPSITKSGALCQSITGTVLNPLAHALPSSFKIQDKNPKLFFDSPEALRYVQRLLGMGVIAPADFNQRRLPVVGTNHWQSNTDPVQVNRTHIGVEGYRRSIREGEEESRGSLVHAMVQSLVKATKGCTFNGSGGDQFNQSSMIDFVNDIYTKHWRPLALVAYDTARSKLNEKLNAASGERKEILKARSLILKEDHRVFLMDSPNIEHAAQAAMDATAKESWRL